MPADARTTKEDKGVELIINKWFLREYLDQVTVGWFDDHDLPPDDLEEYRECVLEMQKTAIGRGEMDVLKLGFEALLADPLASFKNLGNARYAYTNGQVKDIIAYCWRFLWPDSRVRPEGPPGLTLVDSSFAEYEAQRRRDV